MQFHQIANAFPMFTEERLATLAESIKVRGLNRPIVLFEGEILDGRNRYQAAARADLVLGPEDFEDFDGDWDAAVDFVADENLERRDLDRHDRAVTAAKLAGLRRGRPPGNRSRDRFSQHELAAKFEVGVASVGRAKQVLDTGAPELVRAMEKKEIAIKPAAALTKLSEPEQRAALAGGPETVKKAVAEARVQPSKTVELSPVQKAIRRKVKTDNLFLDLMKLMVQIKAMTAQFAAGGLAPTPEQREIGIELAQQLITAGEWLITLFKGDGQTVSDAALSALLEGESE